MPGWIRDGLSIRRIKPGMLLEHRESGLVYKLTIIGRPNDSYVGIRLYPDGKRTWWIQAHRLSREFVTHSHPKETKP